MGITEINILCELPRNIGNPLSTYPGSLRIRQPDMKCQINEVISDLEIVLHTPQSDHTLMESMKLVRLLMTNIPNLFVSILRLKKDLG
jgi:hypothetical protein